MVDLQLGVGGLPETRQLLVWPHNNHVGSQSFIRIRLLGHGQYCFFSRSAKYDIYIINRVLVHLVMCIGEVLFIHLLVSSNKLVTVINFLVKY